MHGSGEIVDACDAEIIEKKLALALGHLKMILTLEQTDKQHRNQNRELHSSISITCAKKEQTPILHERTDWWTVILETVVNPRAIRSRETRSNSCMIPHWFSFEKDQGFQ